MDDQAQPRQSCKSEAQASAATFERVSIAAHTVMLKRAKAHRCCLFLQLFSAISDRPQSAAMRR
jgi:hypothetical protein